jgi:hypothetical protein
LVWLPKPWPTQALAARWAKHPPPAKAADFSAAFFLPTSLQQASELVFIL